VTDGYYNLKSTRTFWVRGSFIKHFSDFDCQWLSSGCLRRDPRWNGFEEHAVSVTAARPRRQFPSSLVANSRLVVHNLRPWLRISSNVLQHGIFPAGQRLQRAAFCWLPQVVHEAASNRGDCCRRRASCAILDSVLIVMEALALLM
jgi:hypothetical protein